MRDVEFGLGLKAGYGAERKRRDSSSCKKSSWLETRRGPRAAWRHVRVLANTWLPETHHPYRGQMGDKGGEQTDALS